MIKKILAVFGFLLCSQVALAMCPNLQDDNLMNFEYALKKATIKKFKEGYRKIFEYDNGIWFMETGYWRMLTGIGLKAPDTTFIEEVKFVKMEKYKGRVRCFYVAEISKLLDEDAPHEFIEFRMTY